ncbi:MAG: hypothetical protein M3235_02895 [Actinomycetota bacterium]|nr:hypothetical protein [Actinomycetota bacterium]
MNESAADWTPGQLRAAVERPPGLRPARPARITIEQLDRTGPDGAGARVDVEIEHAGGAERWQLIFDTMWADIHDFPLEDAALMVRANIEERWDTRGSEPDPPDLTTERLG